MLLLLPTLVAWIDFLARRREGAAMPVGATITSERKQMMDLQGVRLHSTLSEEAAEEAIAAAAVGAYMA